MDANTVFVTSCLNDDENNKMREYIYSVCLPFGNVPFGNCVVSFSSKRIISAITTVSAARLSLIVRCKIVQVGDFNHF